MDFQTLKRKLEEKASAKAGASDGPKWKKRGDMEKERVAKYLAEQEEDRKAREAKRQKAIETKKAAEVQSEIRENKEGSVEAGADANVAESSSSSSGVRMSKEEVIKRLREVGEPATLFGETDEIRWQRLRQLQISGHFDLLIEQGRNDFQDELKRNLQETEKLQAELKFGRHTTDEHQQNLAKALSEKREELANFQKQLEENAFENDEDKIACAIKMFLKSWEVELDEQLLEAHTAKTKAKSADIDAAERHLAKAVHAHTFFKQTTTFVEPLLTALNQRALTFAIITPMMHIVNNMLLREYVKANEWYVKMAIGNAPWPMGVTMVGIHERAGRERVECAKVAHILNNETQRKYIQGMKRLMTQAQRLYPTDPSKCVWV